MNNEKYYVTVGETKRWELEILCGWNILEQIRSDCLGM